MLSGEGGGKHLTPDLEIRDQRCSARAAAPSNLNKGTLAFISMHLRAALRVAAVCAVFSFSFLGAEEDTIEWLNNYKQAIEVAKKTGKPIFLEHRCEP